MTDQQLQRLENKLIQMERLLKAILDTLVEIKNRTPGDQS